jgi:septum site-determining protein MinC
MKKVPRPIAELKGYRDGLRLILDPEASIEQIEAAIGERMANLGDSLAGMVMNIDIGNRPLDDSELTRLKSLLHKNYGLEVRRILGAATDPPLIRESSTIMGAPALHQEERAINGYFSSEHEDTRLIRHTLRSGQVERFLEGNVVVLGDVNPGAEVTAAGDIIVLGSLRGIAHAGALGNTSSVIIALNLQPTQLRIGRFITRPPADAQRRRKQIEIARVQGDAIIVEDYD